MKTTENILVVDLEATCWEGESPPKGQLQEIIEIGVCILNRRTGEITENKGIIVKPEVSEISPFCTQLTTIDNALIEQEGIDFEDALELLENEYDSLDCTWASYGAFDKNMTKRQCQRMELFYPFNRQHINVKELFSEVRGVRKRVGMKRALNILNIPLDGTHHRGVDDARNIAKILNWCLND